MAKMPGHSFPKSFGFHGSAAAGPKMRQAMPVPNDGPPTPTAAMHRGGSTIDFHPDGRIRIQHGMGIEEHDSSELAHRQNFAKGGAVKEMDDEAGEEAADEAQDKKVVKKGVKQHEQQLHGDKRSDLKLARGGPVGKAMPMTSPQKKKSAMHRGHGALNEASAVNSAPANPADTATTPNEMPGGKVAYGVQPGTEADPAASDQGIPQLKKGGKVKAFARGGAVKKRYDAGGSVAPAPAPAPAASGPPVDPATTMSNADRIKAGIPFSNKPMAPPSAAQTIGKLKGSVLDAKGTFQAIHDALTKSKGGKVSGKKSTARQSY